MYQKAAFGRMIRQKENETWESKLLTACDREGEEIQ